MMQFLETRIIPPVVTLIFGALMWGVAQVTPTMQDPDGFASIGFKVVLGLGLMIMLVAAFEIIHAKTTLNPMSPDHTSTLVTNGLYAWSRNPIYVADLFFLISWYLFLSNIYSWVLLFVFVLYMNKFQIEPEERALEEKFGDQYRDYKTRVNRWFWPSN